VTARSPSDYAAVVGTRTIPAGATSTTVSVSLVADNDSEPNETLHLNIDFPINAGISRSQATGTILNDDSSFTFQVGTLDLTPPNATVAVGEKLLYNLSWTVPSPQTWHDLSTIELRIGEGGSLVWIQFEESTRNLSFYNPVTGDFRPSFPAGWPAVLSNGAVSLHLNETSVIAAGPNSPEVTLQLMLSFNPRAVGANYPVEVRATNDFGEFQGFAPAAVLSVVPR
jgi:hypothetical protein